MLCEQKKQVSPDEDLIYELEAALEFIFEEFSETFRAVESLSFRNEITYKLLWTIFPPNALVYAFDDLNEIGAYKVESAGEQGSQQSGKRFIAHVMNYDFDGNIIGETYREFNMNPFVGTMEIENLQCVPIDFHPEGQPIRQNLIERGRKALQLYRRQVVEY